MFAKVTQKDQTDQRKIEMDRGKRQGVSNRIGKDGELLFERWAIKRSLSTNKAETDLGVDFWCQINTPVGDARSVGNTGPVLHAQVKTVEQGENAALELERVDAVDLLRQKTVTVVFGIRLSDEAVHFQFVDRGFIDRLVAFLASDRLTISIGYKKLSNDVALFDKLLKRYSNPFEQMKLCIHLIQKRVTTTIPGSSFSIDANAEATQALVSVPWIDAAFVVDESHREQVRLRYLREGTIDPNHAAIHLHPAIAAAVEESRPDSMVIKGTRMLATEVRINSPKGSLVQNFEYQQFGDEKNFVHRAGLRITLDRARRSSTEGHYEHSLESEIFLPERPVPFSPPVFQFFRMFTPGATIELHPSWKIPIETFDDGLPLVSDAIGTWSDLCKALKLPLEKLSLGDLLDEEFGRTASFLRSLLLENVKGTAGIGFILGAAAELSVESLVRLPVHAEVPILMNWKNVGIVVWLECNADAFQYEGLICGFQLGEPLSWRIQKTSRLEKSIYPEFHFFRDWPAIPMRDGMAGVSTWNDDGPPKRIFEARIQRLPEAREANETATPSNDETIPPEVSGNS